MAYKIRHFAVSLSLMMILGTLTGCTEDEIKVAESSLNMETTTSSDVHSKTISSETTAQESSEGYTAEESSAQTESDITSSAKPNNESGGGSKTEDNNTSAMPESAKGNNTTPAADANESFQGKVIALCNIERAKEGLAPLKNGNAKLQKSADVRVEEIKENFDHTRPSGQSFATILAENNVSYGIAGENIAWGYLTPEKVVDGWMNSPGHRSNIMNASYEYLAVGYSNSYWVQLFIK